MDKTKGGPQKKPPAIPVNEPYKMWIYVLRGKEGINIGSVEGYRSLEECFEVLTAHKLFYPDCHYEIINEQETVVNRGKV